MKKIQKLTLASLFVALGVSLSFFYIPVGPAKCFPIQHMINVLSAVLLGPWYGVLVAFSTSLIRVFTGTGSLLAFPGSMFGAFFAALAYKKTSHFLPAFFGEIFGTGFLGALVAYPVAVYLMGKEAAIFAFVLPFGISSIGGALFAMILLVAFQKTTLLDKILPRDKSKKVDHFI